MGVNGLNGPCNLLSVATKGQLFQFDGVHLYEKTNGVEWNPLLVPY